MMNWVSFLRNPTVCSPTSVRRFLFRRLFCSAIEPSPTSLFGDRIMKKIALAAIASALLIGTCLNAQDLVPIARQGSFTIYAILNDAPQEGFTSHRIVLVNEFGTVNGVGHVNIANSHQVWSSLDSSPEKSAFLPQQTRFMERGGLTSTRTCCLIEWRSKV